MKTILPKNDRFFRALAPGLLAALVCLLPMLSPAQPMRSFGMPPGFGGPPPSSDNSSSSSSSKSDGNSKDTGPWIPSAPLSGGASTNSAGGDTNLIQLSFQGANIDMVVQWLSQTTGKSVLKHPQVQCQLTITSTKKVPQREAVNLVYRALALEGFSAIEFGDSILIVPQDKEPRMSPELLSNSQTNVPEGRQRLVKVFELKHLKASDVKDRIGTALSDKATVFVDEQANQIIITDYNDNIRAVGGLIAVLDTDKPEDVTVRVISLKNISAADLTKEIGPLYEKKNSKNLKDVVEVTADDRSNTLLILSSEANFRAIQQFVKSLDTEEAQEKTMRTYTLKNADAQDVAKQLQDLNQQQATTARYIYNFGNSSSGGDSKKMTVVADRRRNAVIVQAPPSQLVSIEKMISELDAPVTDDSLAPRIFPMKYASATDIEDVLNELFLKKQVQRSYWDYYDDSSSSTPDRDVGRLYGKVRISSEPNSNALIVTANSKENLEAVEAIITQLDRPPEAAESTLHIGLKFAKAADVANSVNVLFAKNGSPPLRVTTPQNQPNNSGQQNPQGQSQQNSASETGFDLGQETKIEGYFPWLGGQPDNARSSDSTHAVQPVSDLIGRVRAVADDRSNALLISANVHFFPQVLKLIADLDAPTDQVLIDARLVEVTSDYLDALGVRWSPNGSQVFTAEDYDNSILATAAANYTRGLGQNTTVNTPSSSTIAQSLASLRSGVLSGSLSMDFLVQFLRKTTDATVLAEPQINIRDNETGKLFVGQQVPVPDTTQISSVGSQNTSIKYKDVGVVLEVTPHINSSGDVELKIHAESSTVVTGQTVLGGAVFNTINFRSDLTAKNGQTLIVGGIIQKQISDTLRKTPIVGDIPGVKWAFNKKDKSVQNVELMVFLRPRVIRTTEDASAALAEVNAQAPAVKKWETDTAPAKPEKKSKK